jgi:hypothetical protein
VELVSGVVLSSFWVKHFCVANNLQNKLGFVLCYWRRIIKLYLQETGFRVINTSFEAQKRSNFDRLVEADVADVAQLGSELAVKVARSPGDFQCLPHQEAPKDFIVQISILQIKKY